jgi:hypothetical protein
MQNPDAIPLAGIVGQGDGASALLLLLVLPLWWIYFRERKRVYGSPFHQIVYLEAKIERMLEETRGHEAALHISEGTQRERVRVLDIQIDKLLTERKILEESMRYGSLQIVRSDALEESEVRALALRRNFYITLTILLAIFVYSIL